VRAIRRDGHRRTERSAWVGQGITSLADPGAEVCHRLLAAFLGFWHPAAVVRDQVTRHDDSPFECRIPVNGAWSEPGVSGRTASMFGRTDALSARPAGTRWLEPAFLLLREEGAGDAPGGSAVMAKIADVFLTEIVRRYLSGLDDMTAAVPRR
jgi:hypothetical protein